MKFRSCCITVSLLSVLACATLAQTASPNSSLASTQVPRLIRFSGVALDETHNPMTGVLGFTFSLYKDQQGGSPLWTETQNVQADANGHYTALLGSASAEGVPLELFSSGEAHWLGVQIQSQPEHARVLLVSVPYALKAHEAETLSGRAISDFVLRDTGDAKLAPTGTVEASSSSSGSGLIPRTFGPTNFSGTNSTNIVTVTQKGGGGGLTASALSVAALEGIITGPTNTAIYGLASNTSSGSSAAGVTGASNTHHGPGVQGVTSSATGLGVQGVVTSNVGGTAVQGLNKATSGYSVGVEGQSSSVTQNSSGVNGFEGAASGQVYGVQGTALSPNGTGVAGFANASSGNTAGVFGQSKSTSGAGVSGFALAISGFTSGVYGQSASTSGTGVNGNATATTGVANGVSGSTTSPAGSGIFGINNATTGGTGTGVTGITKAASGQSVAVYGQSASTSGYGVDGTATAATGNTSGVYGQSKSTSGVGVFGVAAASSGLNFGVLGISKSSGGIGIQAQNAATNAFVALAGNPYLINSFVNQSGKFTVDYSGNGFFAGNLNVTGTLTKGSGSFKIDHPLDPANKYLSHSFVESPDMMNVYNGNITTDRHGSATVVLPDYFEALNRDFRYQLTVIGQFANAIVAKKIAKNRFVIRTSKPGVEVSWQVSGIRQDAYANANRIPVEEVKPAKEQGYYLHPEVFGQLESKSIAVAQKTTPPQDVLAQALQR
jgi:trimeric autotransporter adhesin